MILTNSNIANFVVYINNNFQFLNLKIENYKK